MDSFADRSVFSRAAITSTVITSSQQLQTTYRLRRGGSMLLVELICRHPFPLYDRHDISTLSLSLISSLISYRARKINLAQFNCRSTILLPI